jgi:AraC-like DNA-binding protein
MLERFSRLVSAERRFVLRQEPGERLVLVLDGGRESTEPLGAVFALAAIVALGRNAAGISWSPATVRFRHEALAELPRYEEFFEAPIAFAQSEDALVLGPDTCALPMREADPALLRVLEQYLRKELEALDPAQSLEDAVRTAIMRALPEQNADLETIASHVGLSSRVLQKRLQHAGTSFQEVLDRVRESLAKRYLVQPSFSLAATALALGYSDVTAFHRAFKRWTGVTPGDFRRRALREGEQ